MPIKFACPACSQPLLARDDMMRRKVRCPKCQRPTVVPIESQLRGIAVPGPQGAVAEMAVAEEQAIPGAVEPPSAGGAEPSPAATGTEAMAAFGFVTSAAPPSDKPVDPTALAVPRWLLYAHAGLLAGVAVVALLIGWVIGHATQAGPTGKPVRITGTLTFHERGRDVVDRESAVIVWPDEPPPAGKILSADFSPQRPAPKPDDKALETLRELGGQYVRADSAGKFHLRLAPGTYRVLLVSRNAARPNSTPMKPEDMIDVGQYFASPETICGNQKYLFTTLELEAGSEVKHSFGESGK